MAIHLSGLPGGGVPEGTPDGQSVPLCNLAPGGVYRADRVTPIAGALLPHRFTLACVGLHPPSAVCSLWHFPAGHPDWPLASTLPFGAPTFLDPVPPMRPEPRPPGRLTVCSSLALSGQEGRNEIGGP